MVIGYVFALTAALLWGVSGTLAQYLFQHHEVTPEWLVTVRMLMASAVLLIFPLMQNSKAVFAPWKDKKDRVRIIAFGIFGMLTVQYTYFVTIKHSNAATATILQYLGPVFIAIYYSFIEKRIPVVKEIIAIAFALLGTFLIVTHGSLETLSVTPQAFWWGIASAVALAVYSVLPINLMNRHNAAIVVGWGMLVGGISLSFIYTPWDVPGIWNGTAFIFTGAIVLFGTALPFYLYLRSVKMVGATTASLLACIEPLSAAAVAVVWLKVSFGIFDWIGTVCILITIGLLTKVEKS
ncbi:EamA family transporter [Pseudobdellovibrio sp. HCB154]|uniref:EamA family transporter n=1 Tax=Pseudobdellovibrio sp. HCB154 TaxID=3386277 RepID=UPI0039175EAA